MYLRVQPLLRRRFLRLPFADVVNLGDADCLAKRFGQWKRLCVAIRLNLRDFFAQPVGITQWQRQQLTRGYGQCERLDERKLDILADADWLRFGDGDSVELHDGFAQHNSVGVSHC